MATKRQRKIRETKTKQAKGAVDFPAELEPAPTAEIREPKFDLEIYRDWCKGCGICVAFCPTQVLSMNEQGEPQVSRPELCTGCTWCELRCPDFAITVKRKEKKREGNLAPSEGSALVEPQALEDKVPLDVEED
jgi:2-oxoglutarate ferredoxin oxidoreductase subunit delta